MRSSGEDDGGIYHESHMRGNVLNLDPIAEEHRKPSYKEGAAPDLKDSPLQKDFIYSIEEFE